MCDVIYTTGELREALTDKRVYPAEVQKRIDDLNDMIIKLRDWAATYNESGAVPYDDYINWTPREQAPVSPTQAGDEGAQSRATGMATP